MTDLETEAEQLREIQRLNAHINKQDAEIERLRVINRDHIEAVCKAVAEIERLRTDRNDWKALAIQWAKDNEPLKDTP